MTAPGDRPPRRGWRRVFEPGELRAALDAFRYLARARILHARFPASRLIERLRAPADGPRPARLDADSRERMRRALMAVSRRMPWRSDCMIQSLAARMWLDRLGVPCAFRLGATMLGTVPKQRGRSRRGPLPCTREASRGCGHRPPG